METAPGLDFVHCANCGDLGLDLLVWDSFHIFEVLRVVWCLPIDRIASEVTGNSAGTYEYTCSSTRARRLSCVKSTEVRRVYRECCS